MLTQFEKYNDIILDAFQTYQRSNDLIVKKYEIVDQALAHYRIKPKNMLFLGFSPAIFKFDNVNIYLSDASDVVCNYLKTQSVKFETVDLNNFEHKKFDAVVAMDEYFTFAETDLHQRALVDSLAKLTKGILITSLKDYKNQDYRDRDFSQPTAIRNNDTKKIFFEGYEYDPADKNSFSAINYIIDDEGIMTAGPFLRRTMFFKQLAKFSLDAGAQSFLIHKNIMYKNLIKKNYEHLITIEF
jgi:hypothetical protein